MRKNESIRPFCGTLLHQLKFSVVTSSCNSFAGVCFLLLVASSSLVACGTVRAMTDKAGEIALSAAGIKTPDGSAPLRAPNSVKLRIEAANDLNADEDGQGLSAIVRLYKLKGLNTFLSAPHAAFGYPEKEKLAFGAELAEASELMLSPGQTLELNEKMSAETPYLGVVALFRSPDPKRWRFAFATAEAESKEIILGAHRCAMTATSVPPSGMALSETTLLSSVKCK